jgi:hypothetical protein
MNKKTKQGYYGKCEYDVGEENSYGTARYFEKDGKARFECKINLPNGNLLISEANYKRVGEEWSVIALESKAYETAKGGLGYIDEGGEIGRAMFTYFEETKHGYFTCKFERPDDHLMEQGTTYVRDGKSWILDAAKCSVLEGKREAVEGFIDY